jgi:putative endonuclease
MNCVYVIQNDSTYKLYIGVTNNLKRRVNEHNHHKGDKTYTKCFEGKWILVYAEAYRSKKDAYLRERRLKSHGSGKLELLKRLENSLLETKSGEGNCGF